MNNHKVMGITITSNVQGYCPQCGRPVMFGATVCACGQNLEGLPAVSPDAQNLPVMKPRRLFVPQVTYLLIGLNVLIFLVMTLAGGSTHIQILLDFGAMYRPFIAQGEYWRLITPLFLHIGVMHILFNMYALLILGGIAEQIYGPTRYFYLYLICGVGGTLASAEFSKAVSAGASGAIFGLAGIALVVGYRHRERISASFKKVVGQGIIPFVLFNLGYGLFNKGIDNYAHVGGLLSGALLGLAVPPLPPAQAAARRRFPPPGILIPLAIVLGAFMFPIRAHREMKQVEANFDQALSLEKAGKYDASIAAYQRALEGRPDLPAIHNNLAVIYSHQQKFAEAEKEAREAIRLGPDEAMYHQTLGVVLWRERKLGEAAGQYQRAVELNPQDTTLYRALADIYRQQGELDQALQELNKVKELNPKDASVDADIQYLEQRKTAQKQGH